MAEIKFLDLQAQYRSIKSEIDQAVLGVLDSAKYVLGPEVEAFEREFAAAHEVEHGIAVNSGTSALHLALLAANVGPGDEVITVSMTFTATAAAISYTGATPVFVDVDPVSCTMDPAQIEAKISRKTKAIMPVHLYGQAADMIAIMDIAERRQLVVIEDAAQAHLARCKGRSVGCIGTMAAFSFYPGKNLGAYGEGGLATTRDADLAERMRLLRDWGQRRKYEHDMLAYNYRMDGIQGAILRVKLARLESWTERRRAIAAQYRDRLRDADLAVTTEVHGRRHVYHIFSLFHPQRDALQIRLAEEGIQTGRHYPVPVHLQQAYRGLGHGRGDFPVTERIADQQLSLPIYPELSDEEVERICDVILRWLDR
ncbi:MAG: DegT/DnrJ/EryC1/StrS family aminotransferase [Sphingosinicella sp.]